MKLTKKIVSLAAVLALSCTFAVSAAEVAINGDIVEADGAYSVNLTTDAAETDQYTVLVYKISDEGIADEIATATIPAPSNENITYINQDTFSTIKLSGSDAYSIAFALGANVKGDGTYKVMVGGTGIATAAVGYFEVGAGSDDVLYGDVDGSGEVDAIDAAWILTKAADSSTVLDNEAAADVDASGEIDAIDAAWILTKSSDSFYACYCCNVSIYNGIHSTCS